MLLYLLKADGTDQNSVNIADALWSVAANQAQIASWIQAQNRGFTFYTDTLNDPDAQTLTNMTQIQTWIMQQGQSVATAINAPPPVQTTSTPWGTIALVAALAAVVAFVAVDRH